MIIIINITHQHVVLVSSACLCGADMYKLPSENMFQLHTGQHHYHHIINNSSSSRSIL